MKSVMIIYNQSITEEVQAILDSLSLRGFTQWQEVLGRGTEKGEMHEGSHTWPELNNVHLVVVPDTQVEPLLTKLKELDEETPEQGLRAFVWNIESYI